MTLSRRPRAAIFDLDGVLLDTEHFYTEVTQEIVAAYGKRFDWSVKANMIGRPSGESARYLVETLELPITADEYLSMRERKLVERFPCAEPKPGVVAFTRALAVLDVPLAVATSSEKRLFEIKTSRHRAWFACFSACVTGDDPRVAHGKPAPDIFLVAAAELAVAARDCLVFEDAPAGVAAALAAGMQVVAIPDPGMDRTRFDDATLTIESFADVDACDLGF